MRLAIAATNQNEILALEGAISAEPGYQIIWKSFNSAQVLDLCRTNSPDLLLLTPDLKGPDQKNLTETIMTTRPCPIVIVSLVSKQNSSASFHALGAGALAEARFTLNPDSDQNNLRSTLCWAGRLQDKSELRSLPKPTFSIIEKCLDIPLILVGSSSGGPQALAKMVSLLPDTLKAGMIIVQHIDPENASSLALWLNKQTLMEVRIASNMEKPAQGKILIAGQAGNLVFDQNGQLKYSVPEKDNIYSPCIDSFFLSAVRCCNPRQTVAVLLSGMGNDGARGMLSLRKSGFSTIVQDQASSEIFGMPKAAITLKAAEHILPPQEIARLLFRKFNLR